MDYHDFWVAKVNADGYLQWSKDFTGSGSFSKDIAFGVATTPEGDVVAVGKKDTGLWYSGMARKLSGDGTSLWGKTFGGNGLNEFRDVTIGHNGNYVMVGQTFSGYTYKGWLVALDANGSQVDSKTYVGSGAFDVLRGIEKVSSGGYIAVGCSGLEAINNEDYVDGGKLWLVRLNNDFNVSWHTKYSSNAEGFAVAETADGFIAVGYRWMGSERNMVAVRTAADGSEMWSQVIGWEKDDVLQDVAVKPNGNFLATGYAGPPGKGNVDLIFMEFSGAGAVLWQAFEGGSSTQAGFSLLPIADQEGNYIIGGRNGNEGWLLKVSSCY